MDLFSQARVGQRVRTFPTEKELREYTIESGKYFPKEDAYAGGLLKFLLREIHNTYEGSRGRNNGARGRGKGAGVGKGQKTKQSSNKN
jgi:hypothetical protein